MMDRGDEFSFGNLIGQIRSFHIKWETLKKERDSLKILLEEANVKISELESTIAKYKSKDMIIENERYVLSQVIDNLHKKLFEEDTLSKKIEEIEENVSCLSAVIESSMSDSYGTTSSPSVTGSINDEQERELKNDFYTKQNAYIENNHENNPSNISIGDYTTDNDSSLVFVDEELKSSVLQETSLENEKKENSMQLSKTSTIQSASFSTSVQSHSNASSNGSAYLNRMMTDNCKVILPDFLSSLAHWRPGFYENTRFPHYYSYNLNELPSSVISTSTNFSYQSEAETEIVHTSNSSNDQMICNSLPARDDKNDTFGSKKKDSITQEMNNLENENAGGASSFNALVKLHGVKKTVHSYEISTNRDAKNDESGGDKIKKIRLKIKPVRYNLRERKLLKKRNKSADNENSNNSNSADSHSSKDESRIEKIFQCRKPRKLATKDTNYFSAVKAPADATKLQSLNTTLSPENNNLYRKICMICKKINPNDQLPLFVTYRELDQHIMDNHPDPSPEYHRCPYVKENCKRHFKFKANLHMHVDKWHKNGKSNSPPKDCVVLETSLPCVFCDKVFTCSSDFKNHVKRDHSAMLMKPSETEMTCKFCDFVANSRGKMAIHKLKCQKISQSETLPRESKITAGCDIENVKIEAFEN